ncbi:MAG: DEAD/DEAH box helicase [Tannerella sp.]|jgi:SNF2 family DNA or RNA helicase|nr:DEAD/DEAH box helicase [Tannerella sp.]
MNIKEIKKQIATYLSAEELAHGEIIFHNCDCQILSQSAVSIDFIINIAGEKDAVAYSLLIDEDDKGVITLIPETNDDKQDGKHGQDRTGWNRYSYACLLQYEQELSLLDPKEKTEHKKYTRQGMIMRVLDERRQKAAKATYRIKWANNIYGDHILTNEHGHQYKVFLRDFENETGYSDSWDTKLNKLGTTKHIMFAFNKIKENKELYDRLDKTYPFIEIYCEPLNENKITWYYPHKMPVGEQLLISRYFKKNNYIEDTEHELKSFLDFIEKAEEFETIHIRPEVREKIERVFEQSLLNELEKTHKPDYSLINADFFPYQKEGIEFALFKKSAIIADEMGLGKTLQAISIAVMKKQIFGFQKTLIVCPATLKAQWKKEIERFTNEKALVVTGMPDERANQYLDANYFFYIVNYETVLRDRPAINKAGLDFLILDEAQKIKNYETKTSSAIRRLQPKQTLIITGTPIENRLIDIYSVVGTLDPYFFGPLWEFSYQHCLFDPVQTNRINGYYDLQTLNSQLSKILIRREKRAVLDQLPNIQQIDIPVELSPEQADYHASYSAGISRIISKKFLTAYDLQKLQLLLTSMRMVCDSTYLIDEETNVSPKLEELKYILFEQLDLQNTNRKIIIFSEWIKVHKLIGQMLRQHKVGFAELNGKVPVNLRGELIKKFENNTECKVFLSTEAGGSGLNLQVADILFNFELPWNPAKKNQRIGRIDRLGQKSNKLTIYNFITRNSIEQQIASGLLVKQSLFDGVLDSKSKMDYVDFSLKGRSQFIKQLEEFINQMERNKLAEPISAETPEELSVLEKDLAESIEREDEDTNIVQLSIPFEDEADDPAKPSVQEPSVAPPSSPVAEIESKAAELEQVMNNGMQFLAGLFKMSTGKSLDLEGQQVKVNKETGEVTMTFKLPI